jgi:lincosamide nucleotidyltransferase A/C/D/E
MENAIPEMTAEDVVKFVKLLSENNIDIVIDGGWGVDALLGAQSRRHSDLDIAVQHKDVPAIRSLLESKGFSDVVRDDTRECNFVMGDAHGHQIDFHSYTFDSTGKIIFGLEYPLESLGGEGLIGDLPVKCITPEWMVKFHSGYELDDNDYHDVKLLCQKYGIELPPAFEDFALKVDARKTSE